MSCIHLSTALVRRDERILLVASTYLNHSQPLWNMPGGRQRGGELLQETVVRELAEETGMQGRVRELCYLSESYDGQTHITNVTFALEATGEPRVPSIEGDHVVEAAWIPISEISNRIHVRVVREPLIAFLSGATRRYAGYAEAGISIEFPD